MLFVRVVVTRVVRWSVGDGRFAGKRQRTVV